MATLTVRNLDEALVRKLRMRAARHGRSTEAEHREILRAALDGPQPMTHREAIERLRALSQELQGREFAPSEELLRETRRARVRQLTGFDEEAS